MRKLSVFAFGTVAAAALAGNAIAASPKTHVMNVPLRDGSTARIEYVGDVAPKVSVVPGTFAGRDGWAVPFPSLAGFDRIFDEMNRRTQEMLRQTHELARQPANAGVAAPYIASIGNLPAGQSSMSVVSVSDGATTCTRTTQAVSQGPGKPPKVTTSVSGDCASAPKASGALVHGT